MANVFWVQLKALTWKNWVVLSKHPFVNILRCFLFPVAYGLFLAYAQIFFNRLSNFGIGTPAPVKSLQSQFDGTIKLIWADNSDGSFTSPTPTEIMERITANFTSVQRAMVKQVDQDDFFAECPQNYQGYTKCFAAIAFQKPFLNISGIQWPSPSLQYHIYADWALRYVNVEKHTSDLEKRIMPLQWEIDRAIIELQTGIPQQTPLEWPYTQLNNEDQRTRVRLSFLRGIRAIIGLAMFLAFVGISYQLPGLFCAERSLLLTEHMKVMGLLDSARYISWLFAISAAYLPAWVIVSIVWHVRVFTKTNGGLIVIIHVLLGLVLASYSLFTAVPFGKSPHLAAVVSTFLAILFAIMGLVIKRGQSGVLFVLSILFPPSFYMFSLTALTGYENNQLATNVLHGDPDKGVVLLPLLIAAIIDVFLWPYIASMLERHRYDARVSGHSKFWMFGFGKSTHGPPLPENTAISIRNLKKVYQSSRLFKKSYVTAIEDLSLDIPKTGIFVLLGSNGAGKSTLLSIVAGISDPSAGTVTFPGGAPRPTRGTLGIVPQKNVLFPELTCIQTLRVWQGIKWSKKSNQQAEDLHALLRDCDLGEKADECAGTLSGGQKRKLQLAIGLVGGSTVVLVDECTSGVDPLSRRALWKTLTNCRKDRCLVFTTHFLDEADLLGDQIAILASPGKVIANGSPVALKRDFGQGYVVQATHRFADSESGLLSRVQTIVPSASETSVSPTQISYHLRTRDPVVVQRVLELFDAEIKGNRMASYSISGATIEEIFLDLMSKQEHDSSTVEEDVVVTDIGAAGAVLANLPKSRAISPLQQAMTIFHKRLLIARRSWLTSFLTLEVAIAGACVPLVFMSKSWPGCVPKYIYPDGIPLYLPTFLTNSSFSANVGLQSPPGIIQSLGSTTANISFASLPDNTTFVNFIKDHYKDVLFGGISVDVATGASLIAWEATPPGYNGLSALNLVSNVLYNGALNTSGLATRIIDTTYRPFPFDWDEATVGSLRWLFYFAAAMAVYPAFCSMYVSQERRSSVQAMQFSNGLSNPMGLWLGHLMFDSIKVVIISTLIIIVYAIAASRQLHGLGFLWFILIQYGITGALFAYCVSLFAPSPLGAFAIAAAYQFVFFILYNSSYFFILTFAPVTRTNFFFNVIHFSISILAPIGSVVRAAIISVNLFSLLCDGNDALSLASLGSLSKFGGPILYLFVYMFALFAILIWADSGSRVLWMRNRSTPKPSMGEKHLREDVTDASMAVADSDDVLRVLGISKSYGAKRVLEDVSLGVSEDGIFALLGPNGAGKTTTFNVIRGDVIPDEGNVFINGTSVIRDPRKARSFLGVCPQFTAIDSQLSVREHLMIYGRLKGLRRGTEIRESINAVLQCTALVPYADRLASKLSGGNQRKLSLAIALIGNPSVLLIDEFSTGIDPKMKRDMWQTLRRVAVGKAVVVTTHSMEEASALASNVAILAKSLLAVGTVDSLSSRYPAYEVHFSCRNNEEALKARRLMSLIPGSQMADDVATRFEVPIRGDANEYYSLSQLFRTLSENGDFTDYTVEKATLESVFIKVIRENNVKEEQSEGRGGRRIDWSLC